MKKALFFFLLFLFGLAGNVLAQGETTHGFLLTPSSVEFVVSSDFTEVFPQEQRVKVACTNAILSFQGGDQCNYRCAVDCANTSFTWQFVAQKDWLVITPDDINQLSNYGYVTFSVNASRLGEYPPETCDNEPCFTSDVEFHIRYDLNDCTKYCNNQAPAPAAVTYYQTITYPGFVRVYLNYNGFRVSPERLDFVGFVSNQGIVWQNNPLTLMVEGGFHGWTYWTDVDWLSLVAPNERTLQVQVLDNFSQAGEYLAHVFVKDHQTGRIETIEVHVLLSSDLVVSPTNIGFQGVLAGGVITGLAPRTVSILPAENWSFQVQGNWFSVEKTPGGLLIRPEEEVLKIQGPGVYNGQVTVTFAPTGSSITINLTAEIREPLTLSQPEVYFQGEYVLSSANTTSANATSANLTPTKTLNWDRNTQTINIFGQATGLSTYGNWVQANLAGNTLSLQLNNQAEFKNGRYVSWARVFNNLTGEESLLRLVAKVKDPTAFKNFTYDVFLPGLEGFYAEDALEILTGQIFQARFHLPAVVSGTKRLYVMATHSALPGYVFAYQKNTNQFVVASKDGLPVPGIDELVYLTGNLAEVEVGPYPLFGLPGDINLTLKLGTSWYLSTPVYTLTLHVLPFSGRWEVTDLYCEDTCTSYRHPYPLEVKEELGRITINWGDYHPSLDYQAPDCLYRLFFSKDDLFFEYKVKDVEKGILEGEWFYYRRGKSFGPYPFSGIVLTP